MRLRYFLITAFVLSLVSGFSLLTHNYLAQKDEQANSLALLKQTAITLQQIDWAKSNSKEFQRIEYILSEEISDNVLNRFFILKEASQNTIYKSKIVDLLGLDNVPTSPEWLTLFKDHSQIRVFNLRDERFPDRILQVGLVTPNNIASNFTNPTLWTLFLSIGILGALSSWLLSGILFSPISKVGGFLASATQALEKKGVLPNVPQELFMYLGKKDELRILTEDLNELLNQINKNYKTSRLWAAQMAHELKTPLSQLMLHLETTTDSSNPQLQKSYSYIYAINATINTFLEWAELENRGAASIDKDDVNVSSVVRTTIAMLPESSQQRLQCNRLHPLVIKADPNHLAQLLQNLISNALKYSEEKVIVEVSETFIKVSDSGKGIPENVLLKIGDPFNFGNSNMSKKGHGLGLAWIKTICAMYDWTFDVQSSSKGTAIMIGFK